MALTSGTRLGPYEVVSAIGAGGMGEVYRARDTKLHRDVAIKVLPDAVASDPERLTRFQREAEALAALNHPNIATIYGVEESSAGRRALAMELVDGPTLADRLAQGAMPLTDALHVARQIADALEAAHERGIVHRDLKPSNVKLTPDGVVKLLDFGLAKSFSSPGGPIGSDASNSPTLMPASMEGVILGTAAYMSPEQASGRQVDRRADIWAFGVVLFEMLSGRPLFQGETTAHILAEVLKSDPAWGSLPKTTPPEVHELLERCLRRNPRARLRDIGDARTQIDDWLARPEKTRFPAAAPLRGRQRPSMALAAGSLAIAAAVVGLTLWWEPTVSAPPTRTWEFTMGDYQPDIAEFVDGPAISPNGTMIAFGGSGRGPLRMRDLDSLTVRELPGTDGARQPFWSPDSAFIGYHVSQGAQSIVWKVEARGAAPIKICDAPPGVVWASSWGPDRAIWLNMAYGPEAGELFTVADRGGHRHGSPSTATTRVWLSSRPGNCRAAPCCFNASGRVPPISSCGGRAANCGS